MSIAEFKSALRKDPTLVKRDPSENASKYHLTEQEKTWVEQLTKQCMKLEGKELEDRITKGGFFDG